MTHGSKGCPCGSGGQSHYDSSRLREEGLPIGSLEPVAVRLYVLLEEEPQEDPLIPCEKQRASRGDSRYEV
jgi:hypothetical protein